jgi:hypothetical protein
MAVPSLSVVIPTHDTCGLTLRCLSSLGHGGVEPVDVIVVDDASTDGTAEAVRRTRAASEIVELDRNVGFSRAANRGAERARGDVLLFLNSDTEILEGALAALVAAFADDPKLGVAGGELFNFDGSPQWRAGRRPTPVWLFLQSSGLGSVLARMPGRGLAGASGGSRTGEVDWVSGAALAVRREVWTSCGPFDDGYRFYCQDLDLCASARAAGWPVAVVVGFRVMHARGASISAVDGASEGFHPALMWCDLVRFAGKKDGDAAGRRAARTLRAGARLRLIGRSLLAAFASDRDGWSRDTAAYRRGLDALRELR